MARSIATDRYDVTAAADTGLCAIHAEIAAYYTGKITMFGATPLGVDWTGVLTQELRFVQLLKLCNLSAPCSLNDIGCGYGALIAYLERRHSDSAIDYVGVDLSAAMVRHARRLWHDRPRVRFVTGYTSPRIGDYSIASGIFNVQLNQPRCLWEAFIADTLHHLNRTSTYGFAINFVEGPLRGQRFRHGLYTTEPKQWSQYCAQQFGAATEVIDGYGLSEFTLLVRPVVTS
jgi:SAM-dependent methyltransferase